MVGEHVLEPPGGDLIGGLRAALAGARPPAPPRHLVIGVQAAVDPATGRLGYATAEDMPGWHVGDLVDRLSRGLGVPVSVENNVNLVALAERAHGAAAGTPDFVLLWADAGIGSAIVLGGRLHRGATGGAGEVGYMPAPGAPTARESGPYADHGFQALSGGAAVLRVLRSARHPGRGPARDGQERGPSRRGPVGGPTAREHGGEPAGHPPGRRGGGGARGFG
ncbi:ROK family protein [Nonomuraea ferruginea]